MSDTKPNAKDSMRSTWRHKDRSQWNMYHWFYEMLGIHPSQLDRQVPVFEKTEKMRPLGNLSENKWVLVHASIPIAVHHLFVTYTGHNLTPLQTVVLYSLAFKLNAINHLHQIRRLGYQVGFLDGDTHERDEVPDVGTSKVVHSLLSTSTFRPIFTVFLGYRMDQTPAQMNWYMLPLEAGLYGIILDFWFYWYHRIMHESETLWKYHRTHHLTKHPNPLLTLYADHEQEFFDIAGIPLMTYYTMRLMGMPMGFYEWWICHQYVVFAELAGHSGLRLRATPPSPFAFLLEWFGAELVIEDHDMHHRKGWKTSGNYGKQTRLWDKIFGTLRDRIETTDENVDWQNPVYLSLF